MRPTLTLILLLALLALGGTLYFFLGRPEATPSIDAGTSPAAVSRSESPSSAQLEPASPAAPDALARPERTSIEAPPAAPVAAAKSATATLVGRVIDSAGQPIAGAEVRANIGDFDFPDFDELSGAVKKLDPLRASSDALGRFEIAGVKPGSVRVSVRSPGFVPLIKPGVGIPAVARHDLGDLALETSVILEGHVVDTRGAPVEGARITRSNAEGVMLFSTSDDAVQGPPALAVTAADGSFRIDQLASGPWRLRIASETHPDKTESGSTRRPGERVPGLSFVLEDGFEIAGRVTGVPPASVKDVSVVAAPGGAGQNELFLTAGDEMGENHRRAKVGSDGGFVVRGLRQGNYQVQARVKGSRDVFWPRSASERVEAKSGDRGVMIAWQPASVLSFQIVDAVSKAPIEQLRVSASLRTPMAFFDPAGPESRRYENGMVQLDDLRPRDANDRATLDVEATGYQKLHKSEIALTRGMQTDLGVLELKRATTVDVRVIDSVTRGGIAKAKVTLRVVDDEASSGGAFSVRRTVTADADSGDVHFGGSDSSTARTDEQGLARLNSTPGKRGKLSVSIDGYAPFTSEAFDMPEDANVEQQVVLDQGGSVEITLLAADGTPVSGARIDHRAPDSSGDPFAGFEGPFGRGKGAATDTDGKVTLANLAPGIHRFRPAKAAGAAEMEGGMMIAIDGMLSSDKTWSEVEIVRGATATLVLREPERAEVKGHIREAGSVLAGASISLKKRDAESRFEGMDDLPFADMGGMRAKSDGEGRYRFDKVDAGSYELVVRHSTRAMAMRYPIEVDVSGLEYDIDLPVTILEGRVLDGEKKPVAGAKVWAERKPADEQNGRRARMFSVVAGSDEGMVFDSMAGLDQSRARTDAEGRYSLRGVESDTDLVVQVDAKDCEPTKSEPVSVALGQTKSGVDVQVSPAGQIKAKVVTAGGKSAGPCMVHAEYIDVIPGGKTLEPKLEFAQGGSVTLKGLRPGRWRLYADPMNFGGEGEQPEAEKKEVLVVSHETAQVELSLP